MLMQIFNMMCTNSVQKLAYFCVKDFKPKLFSQIKIALTAILLQSRMNFLMFPSLEIMELKQYTEIWPLNCVLSLDLIYCGCSFDVLLEPFRFFLTANITTTSTQKYSFRIRFLIFLGFTGDLFGNEPHNGILVEGFEKRTLS